MTASEIDSVERLPRSTWARLIPSESGSQPGRFIVELYLSTLRSPQSRRSMRASLTALARLASADPSATAERLDWLRLTYPTAVALRSAASDRWATATVNRHLAALRGVVKAGRLSNFIDRDMAEALAVALTSLPATHDGADPAARLVTDGELRAVFAGLAGRSSPVDRRDAAAVAIMAMTGVRRSELVALDRADLADDGVLLVRKGKGGKRRKVWLHGTGLDAVRDWLAVRGDWDGPLLSAVDRSGDVVTDPVAGRLSGHAIWKRVQRLTARADVPAFSPHDLRGKLASDLLDAGGDIQAVRGLLGHASVSTTARYDRRGERAARRVSLHAHVPYVPPEPA